jgi:hypothetical protein
MPSLASFNAFVKATGIKIATDPNRIINDATKNTYMIGRMLKGRDASLSVQSGQKIRQNVQLSNSGTAVFYHPNEALDIQNVDNLTSIEVDWRFLADHYSYTEEEITLNSGDPQTFYTNLLKAKRQACETSIFNKMEDALWAAPSNSSMELSSGKLPYSIPTFITSDGLAPSGFTTLETVNPSTESGWRNQVESYDPSNVTDTQTGLVNAMDSMWHKVNFVAPMGGPREYFENDQLQKMVIASNLDGVKLLQRLTRDSNDRLVPANNLGWTAGNVSYAGLPVEYVSTLNDALVNNGAVMTAGQPFFYYVNLMYLFPIFHNIKYMSEKEPIPALPHQPFSMVVWKNLYYNMFCASRRRLGIIVPA